MYEELLKTLRDFTPFSIIVSAVVYLRGVSSCVFVIFSFAKREKRIEQLRWNKKLRNYMMWPRCSDQ